MVRGECLAAKDAGERLATLGAAAANDVLLMNGHMQAQIACHHLGEFANAAEHARVVMTLADRASHAERCISILDPIVASLAESARNRWITGYLVTALADCEAAVRIARELRHPDSLAFAWLFHAWLHGYRGDWRRCLASTETGLAIAREAGSVQTFAWNQCIHGWALVHVGDARNGEAEMVAAIDASKAIFGHVALPQFSAMMTEALLVQENLARADVWLAQATEFENSHDDRYFAAELRRLTGVCQARHGRTDEARAAFLGAIDVARAQGATTFELRAAVSLASVDATAGRLALRDVLRRFPEPDPWPDLTTATSLADSEEEN
jgi:hypothetical protein